MPWSAPRAVQTRPPNKTSVTRLWYDDPCHGQYGSQQIGHTVLLTSSLILYASSISSCVGPATSSTLCKFGNSWRSRMSSRWIVRISCCVSGVSIRSSSVNLGCASRCGCIIVVSPVQWFRRGGTVPPPDPIT